MPVEAEEKYMKRCLELAAKGKHAARPNPMVGSVIVHDGKIIGEGYHERCGEAHAEVNAIASVSDATLLESATLYVNLEPCAHHGKTPPCCDLIIAKKIPRVVVGCVDSFSSVSGKGIARMREAGIDVKVGVLEEAARFLNRRFFTMHENERPYVVLKWAESADGFIAPVQDKAGESVAISSDASRALVHEWRAAEAGILVGAGTVWLDNPSLTVRLAEGPNPLRIILGSYNIENPQAKLFQDGGPTLWIHPEKGELPQQVYHLIQDPKDLPMVLKKLAKLQIQSILVEGGTQVLQAFINAGLWDEIRRFKSKNQLQGGVAAPTFSAQSVQNLELEGDQLDIYFNSKG